MFTIEKINHFFYRMADWIIRYRYVNLLLFLALIGIGVSGISKIKPDSGWDSWMLDKSPLKIADEEFKAIFGNNDYVAVMVEVEDIFTPPVLSKIRALGKELEQKVPFADEVLSITDCEFSLGNASGIEIINLVPDPIPNDPEKLEAIRRLALSKRLLVNRLISRDCTQSWIILRLQPFPEGWRSPDNQAADMEVGRQAIQIINQDCYASLNPKAAGMPVLASDKMDFFKNEMKRTMGLSLLVSFIVLSLALRTIRGVMISVIVAFSSVLIAYGIQGLLGISIDISIVVIPIYLGIAVSIAYAIHMFYFFDKKFAENGKRRAAIRYAIRETGWPILFTALTTIAALMSFLFVDVKPVRWIGMATSLLVLVILILVIVMIPTFLCFGRDKPSDKTGRRARRVNRRLEAVMDYLAVAVMRHPKVLVAGFVMVVAVAAIGFCNFEVSFDIRKSMGMGVSYVKRLDHVSHSAVGSMYSYNLVVTFPDNRMALEPENMEKFDNLIREAETYRLTKRTKSVVEIIKDMYQVLNADDPAFYRIPETRQMIAQILLLYENAGGKEADKWMDYEYKRLRMEVELEDYNSRETKRELICLEKTAKSMFPDADISLAGSVAQFTIMQDVLSRGQIISFFTALVVISIMMMIVFGSIKTGMIAMIPNITPALLAGGLMGWTDVPLDMMTITIMPMLLGLAVDDTIHFINHAKLEFERTGSYHTSLRRTFAAIGIPLLFTTLIITANFSVYMTSVANVYVNMGLVTGVGLITALLADYLVTPVLLVRTRAFSESIQKEKKNPNMHVLRA